MKKEVKKESKQQPAKPAVKSEPKPAAKPPVKPWKGLIDFDYKSKHKPKDKISVTNCSDVKTDAVLPNIEGATLLTFNGVCIGKERWKAIHPDFNDGKLFNYSVLKI